MLLSWLPVLNFRMRHPPKERQKNPRGFVSDSRRPTYRSNGFEGKQYSPNSELSLPTALHGMCNLAFSD